MKRNYLKKSDFKYIAFRTKKRLDDVKTSLNDIRGRDQTLVGNIITTMRQDWNSSKSNHTVYNYKEYFEAAKRFAYSDKKSKKLGSFIANNTPYALAVTSGQLLLLNPTEIAIGKFMGVPAAAMDPNWFYVNSFVLATGFFYGSVRDATLKTLDLSRERYPLLRHVADGLPLAMINLIESGPRYAVLGSINGAENLDLITIVGISTVSALMGFFRGYIYGESMDIYKHAFNIEELKYDSTPFFYKPFVNLPKSFQKGALSVLLASSLMWSYDFCTRSNYDLPLPVNSLFEKTISIFDYFNSDKSPKQDSTYNLSNQDLKKISAASNKSIDNFLEE